MGRGRATIVQKLPKAGHDRRYRCSYSIRWVCKVPGCAAIFISDQVVAHCQKQPTSQCVDIRPDGGCHVLSDDCVTSRNRAFAVDATAECRKVVRDCPAIDEIDWAIRFDPAAYPRRGQVAANRRVDETSTTCIEHAAAIAKFRNIGVNRRIEDNQCSCVVNTAAVAVSDVAFHQHTIQRQRTQVRDTYTTPSRGAEAPHDCQVLKNNDGIGPNGDVEHAVHTRPIEEGAVSSSSSNREVIGNVPIAAGSAIVVSKEAYPVEARRHAHNVGSAGIVRSENRFAQADSVSAWRAGQGADVGGISIDGISHCCDVDCR